MSSNSEAHVGGTSPLVTADMMCSPEDGGAGCMLFMHKPGYAKWMDEGFSGYASFVVNDVRAVGSSPLTYYMEHAEMFLTSLHPSTHETHARCTVFHKQRPV